jgi:hypothetical protein
MADINFDRPERPARKLALRRYAVIDRLKGTIVATHDDEAGAEREVITTGNPMLVVLDLEQPPTTTTAPACRAPEPAAHAQRRRSHPPADRVEREATPA